VFNYIFIFGDKMPDGSNKCGCGCGRVTKNKTERVIFPCAGASNVGQLTNDVALELTRGGYANISCMAALAVPIDSIVKGARGSDEVIVIDGCGVRCAGKAAEKNGINIHQHLMITKLGIKKSSIDDRTAEDVEAILYSVLDGEGVKDVKNDIKSSGDCCDGGTCSCGCSSDQQ